MGLILAMFCVIAWLLLGFAWYFSLISGDGCLARTPAAELRRGNPCDIRFGELGDSIGENIVKLFRL
jgi:hypothetical protein